MSDLSTYEYGRIFKAQTKTISSNLNYMFNLYWRHVHLMPAYLTNSFVAAEQVSERQNGLDKKALNKIRPQVGSSITNHEGLKLASLNLVLQQQESIRNFRFFLHTHFFLLRNYPSWSLSKDYVLKTQPLGITNMCQSEVTDSLRSVLIWGIPDP